MSALGQKQTYAPQKAISALSLIATAKADSQKGHVRFTPESGHVRCNYRCLQRPEARHESSDAHRKQTPG